MRLFLQTFVAYEAPQPADNKQTHVHMNEIDRVANVLKDGLERHVQLARVDSRHIPAAKNCINALKLHG